MKEYKRNNKNNTNTNNFKNKIKEINEFKKLYIKGNFRGKKAFDICISIMVIPLSLSNIAKWIFFNELSMAIKVSADIIIVFVGIALGSAFQIAVDLNRDSELIEKNKHTYFEYIFGKALLGFSIFSVLYLIGIWVILMAVQ